MEHADVAVVGGGPAGTAAAIAAATNNASVMLFEQGVPRENRDTPGADSTDAAGILDYWIDIMGIHPDDIPDKILFQTLNRAEFTGPSTNVILTDTGEDAEYPHFGFTFDRAKFDAWRHQQARDAGAELHIGTGVASVDTDYDGDGNGANTPTHTVTLKDGTTVTADTVILADGPQRRVTLPTLDGFLPDGVSVSEVLSPPIANHIAYQEYREFPEELIDRDAIKFWWGWMPGETAYPWVFPNDGQIQRVGLTMPIGLSLEDIENPGDYRLLESTDDSIPQGSEYIRRLLQELYGDSYDIEEDFPIVTDHGKHNGTETYPISSTAPIESPTAANIAVVGGAMGTTSAFHEGGDHTAIRTGKIAGELAATRNLDEYNAAWKDAIGYEIARNVAKANLVSDYTPADWDHVFSIANTVLASENSPIGVLKTGVRGVKVATQYWVEKRRLKDGAYIQLHEDAYCIDL